jgi:hypothetical protein
VFDPRPLIQSIIYPIAHVAHLGPENSRPQPIVEPVVPTAQQNKHLLICERKKGTTDRLLHLILDLIVNVQYTAQESLDDIGY